MGTVMATELQPPKFQHFEPVNIRGKGPRCKAYQVSGKDSGTQMSLPCRRTVWHGTTRRRLGGGGHAGRRPFFHETVRCRPHHLLTWRVEKRNRFRGTSYRG